MADDSQQPGRSEESLAELEHRLHKADLMTSATPDAVETVKGLAAGWGRSAVGLLPESGRSPEHGRDIRDAGRRGPAVSPLQMDPAAGLWRFVVGGPHAPP